MDYDKMAEAYVRNRGVNKCVVDMLGMHSLLGPHSFVLEVGCGTASHLLYLIEATGCRG